MLKESAKYLGFTVALLLLSVPLLHAQTPDAPATKTVTSEKSHKRGHWAKKPSKAKVLSLNAEQEKQLDAIQQKQYAAKKTSFEQLRTTGAALMDEIAKANPDNNKVNALQSQLKTLQGQMADEHLNAMLEIKKIMSPEQFAGYVALEKQKKMAMMDRPGKWRHGGHHGGK